jgi:LysM repeat protein
VKLIENTATIREETVAFRKGTQSFIKRLTLEGRGTPFCLLRCAAIVMLCLVLIAPSSICLADEIPPHVLTVIKQKAAREFPNDENLRLMTIERQREAYIGVKNYSNTRVPENILNRIRKRVVFECPGNYCAQQYLIESQSRDYLYLKDYLPKDVSHQAFIKIMRSAELEFPDDFSTQRLIVDAKVKKYRDLEKVSSFEGEARGAELSDIEKETIPGDTTPQIIQKEEQAFEAIHEDSKEAVEKTDKDKRYHIIRKGENLYRISLRYGLSVPELCHINGINPKDAIKPGQKLLVTP